MSGHDIIVIGASAGGVETLKLLIQGIPPTMPATIFVVLHTSPHSPSILPHILNRVSKLPVKHPQHRERFEQGIIFIAPPDHHMMLEKHRIHLNKGPKVNASRPSIDVLFLSAAQTFGGRVIGIVLTGMLDDGSFGLQKIKQAGGIAVVQDPFEAIFPSMPQNAINATQVDYILPVLQIAPHLVELVKTPVQEVKIMADKSNSHQHDYTGQNDRSGEDVYKRGKQSTYVCPDCGGVLAEFQNGDVLHFECRVGHVYSAESLFAIQSEKVEEALWVALRALEEGASYARRMAEQAQEKKHDVVEKRFEEKADDYERQADVLRKLLLSRA